MGKIYLGSAPIESIAVKGDSAPSSNVSVGIPAPQVFSFTYDDSASEGHFTFTPTLPSTITEGTSITFTIDPATYWPADADHDGFHFTITGATLTGNDTGSTSITVSNPTTDVVLTLEYSAATCLAKGTMVMLYDGTCKPIEEIGYDDLLLTYDPVARMMVGQNPIVVSVGKKCDKCVLVSFEDGTELTIGESHAVYDMHSNLFVTIHHGTYEEKVDMGTFAGARYANGSFNPIRIASITPLDVELEVYSVYTPMNGAIITNGLLTSGDLFSYEKPEYFLKGGRPSMDWNLDFVYAITDGWDEAQMEQGYLRKRDSVAKYGAFLPKELYQGSLVQYLERARNMGVQPIVDAYGSEEGNSVTVASIINGCFREILPYPDSFDVRIVGGETYHLRSGERFTFPEGHAMYLSLTDYKRYCPNETKTMYVGTTLVPID